MIKQVGDKHNFKDWKFGLNCKYDSEVPDFWKGKTDAQKHEMWEKYMIDTALKIGRWVKTVSMMADNLLSGVVHRKKRKIRCIRSI